MGSKSVCVDLDVYLEDFSDGELLEELQDRGVKLYTSVENLIKDDKSGVIVIETADEISFIDGVKQMIWELDTAKVQIIQRLINDSHHKRFLEAV